MKKILAAVVVLMFGLSMAAPSFAQSSKDAQLHVVKSDSKAPDSKTKDASAATASASSSSTTSKHVDLTSMLTDAESAVSATNTDLANLRTDKWASGWKTGFIKKSSHKQQANQTADMLKQQAGALPAMISEVRAQHGSVGSTFKLYNNVTLVCENLDILAEATQNYGKKEEYNRLSADYANLLRIRSSLSSYVEQRAAVVDPRGNAPVVASAPARKDDSAPPKKIVAKSKKKKPVHAAQYTNQ
ncbi:MAG: hypothetical protein LAO20_01300 [Acidobacteriia bacterium]|nr:hypothetical protein [Terriglobia bacterium]